LNYIKIGKEEKLECVLGGERHGNMGYFVKPTIFKNVPDSSKLA
jgi:aldehyde dehydrogenase (NAD+)